MLRIKRKGLLKPWKRRLAIRFTRGVAFGVVLIATILIGIGFIYTWYSGKNARIVQEKVENEKSTNIIKHNAPPQDAAVGVSVQTLTQQVIPGSEVSMSVRTTDGASCKIAVMNDSKQSMTDSDLVTKTADEYGMVNWTWTVPYSAALGSWNVDVNCYRYAKSGFGRGELIVVSQLN